MVEWGLVKTRRDWLIFSATLAALIVVLRLYGRFLTAVESRPGVILPDPLLPHITPRDATWPAFILLYGGLLLAVLGLMRNGKRLVFAMQAYTVMVAVRMAVLYLIPLEPPHGMIALRDPLVEGFAQAKTLTKDLFFSGHTSTLFLMHLVSEGPILRLVFLIGTVLAAACVLTAHVHYMVDVAAAPFFAYGCYRLVGRLHQRFAPVPQA